MCLWRHAGRAGWRHYCCGGVVHQLPCHLGFWTSTKLADTVGIPLLLLFGNPQQPGCSLLKLRDPWSGHPVTFEADLKLLQYHTCTLAHLHTCTLPTVVHTAFPGNLAENQGAPIFLIS